MSAAAASSGLTSPPHVVEDFLSALAAPDIDRAETLMSDDIAYTNVSLPTIHGRKRVAEVLRGLEGPRLGFEVYLHALSAEGPVVLTERTDVILVGPVRAQFWVCGRFEVHDGRITVWRDYFDWVDIGRAALRGIAGAIVPRLRARPPSPETLRRVSGAPTAPAGA